MALLKPTLDSITFDTSDWKLREQSASHRMWMTDLRDAVLLRYFAEQPLYPYDFRSLEAARRFYDAQSIENGGAMISVDFVKVDGIDVMKGLFKYHSPDPRSMGMYYVGVLAMLYRDFSFQINTEALEVGETGAREAAVALTLNEKSPEEKEPVHVESMDELFTLMRSKQVCRISADNEEYDAAFPNHPLSKVRTLQSRILKSLKVLDVVRNSEAYRI
ncbi:MAG: hypothetical protein F6K30_11645 [Cyanothece sp. SIO2G6]|nr:hypothetical protein [Cyanothece sp. SIO2G6]